MEEEIETIPDGEDESLTADKQIWDQKMTLCLIDEYRNHLQDFLHPQGRMMRDIWERISLNMHAKGYGVSASSCDEKWRQLKKTFKYNQPINGKKTKPKWIYYEALEDILNNEEITKRISWKQRSAVKQEANLSPGFVQESSQNEEAHSCNSVNGNNIGVSNYTKEEKPPKWFEVFLNHYHDDEERKKKMLQKMHADLVALEKQKCILLENLIKRIPKPEPVPKIVDAVSLSQEAFEGDKLNFSFNGV